jgi:uncharacterized protein DUF6894
MTRYFFDVVAPKHKRYDYQGRLLKDPEHARECADLMALDLQVDPDCDCAGWSIQVRDAVGRHFASVPVRPI